MILRRLACRWGLHTPATKWARMDESRIVGVCHCGAAGLVDAQGYLDPFPSKEARRMQRCPVISDRQARCLWEGDHPGVEHRWDRDNSAVAHPALALRPATIEDRQRTWAWRNAPDVRAVSFDDKPIAFPQHCAWYERALAERTTSLYIVTFGGPGYDPIGVLRLDSHGVLGYVSIILDEKVRGRGLATPAILMLDDEAQSLKNERHSRFDCRALVALIKVPNSRSHGAFIRAGYKSAFHDGIITMMVKSCP